MTEDVTDSWVRLIPALPLLGAVVHGVMIGLFRRSLSSRAAAFVTLASVGAAFLFVLLTFAELPGRPGGAAVIDRVGTWIGAGVGPRALVVDWALRFDPLAAVMCLLVSGGGLLALVYAGGVLHQDTRDDRGEQRFFALAGLALSAMLLLVLADDAVLLVAAWSVLGVATWWLLGFWYGDDAHARPAMLAFVVGRVGDAALLGAFAMIFQALAEHGGIPAGLQGLRAAQPVLATLVVAWPEVLGGGAAPLAEVASGLVLLAMVTKAAQLPLSGWLAEAVEAPTPALVLVHTVLTVAAPVYVGARLAFLFGAAPIATATAAWIGASTALVGAWVACAQVDVYRLLAWSTASQLGYALVALAAAAESAAIFQLLAHALHKGLLFMAMGAAVAAIGGVRDIRLMGNLGNRLWRTRIDTWVAALSIGGALPLTAGFFALQQVVVAAGAGRAVPGQAALTWVVLLAVSLTAFGIVRLIHETFYGDTRIPASVRWEDIEDPGRPVIWSMGVLTVAAVAGALISMPQIWADLLFTDVENANSLRHFLAEAPAEAEVGETAAAPSEGVDPALRWLLAGRAVSMALLGALPATWLYVYRRSWLDAAAGRLRWLHRALLAGFGLGPALGRLVGTPSLWLAERVLAQRVEVALIEGVTLRGSASAVQRIANAWVRRLQSGSALQYAATAAVATVAAILLLSRAGRG